MAERASRKLGRTLIYGSGAVGLGLASCLLAAGERPAILARPETARRLSRKGLQRTGLFGRACAPPDRLDVVSTLDDLPPALFDCVLVCVKSYDSEAAARDLQAHGPLVGPQVAIVLFQNRWCNAQVFAVMGAAGYASHWPTARDCLAEIDALNGAIIDLGRAHHAPTLANEFVYRLIKQLESQGQTK